jgi:pimeloyl-ACP methyl ester carboxylesterase
MRWRAILLAAMLPACGSASGPVPAASHDASPALDAAPTVAWSPCDTTQWPSEFPLPGPDVECTQIDAPLDRADPAGAKISLRVARQRARRPSTGEAIGKAIFQIAGGPGGSSIAQSGLVPTLFPRLRDEFDLVYLDQRGTGGSGYLDCPHGYPSTESAWRACGKSLAGQPLQHFLTVDAAHDLELVRATLGYPKIFLRAGSYGTRLALELLRQHPDSVAAAVLDGVDPPDGDFFAHLAHQFDLGISWLLRDCAADPSCVAVSPSLEADLVSYRAQVAKSPRAILVADKPNVEDEPLFLSVLEATLYDTKLRFQVPRAIHDAVSGRYDGWNAVLASVIGSPVRDDRDTGRSYVAAGTWMTVECAEDFPFSGGLATIDESVAKQTWPTDRAHVYGAVCQTWPVHAIDAATHAPVVSDVPTLLLSGEIDLRTPPDWAARAQKTLSHGTHLVVPQAFHGTMLLPCVADVISDFFLAEGDASRVSRDCIAKLPKPSW